MGTASFHLIDTSSFHIKAEKERLSAVGSRCRQNLKFETFKSLFFAKIRENEAGVSQRPKLIRVAEAFQNQETTIYNFPANVDLKTFLVKK